MLLKLKRRILRIENRPRRAIRRLHVETLEGRQLLASSLTGITLPYSAAVTTSLVAVNGEMFFGAHDATHGYQLWESNGTSSGTQMLTDIHAPYGISPANLTAVGNELYFSADDGPDGMQLWKSNGTPSGHHDGHRRQPRPRAHAQLPDQRSRNALLRGLRVPAPDTRSSRATARRLAP